VRAEARQTREAREVNEALRGKVDRLLRSVTKENLEVEFRGLFKGVKI
jgi:hypothetical protein